MKGHGSPGHDSARNKHHCAALLQYFRELPRNLSDKECPSTLELIRDGRFGQRPPNRINNLTHGDFDDHKYDFERISCGRGVYRWRLHEPNRPGYPKDKNQIVLPLNEAVPVESDYMRRAREEQERAAPLFAKVPA